MTHSLAQFLRSHGIPSAPPANGGAAPKKRRGRPPLPPGQRRPRPRGVNYRAPSKPSTLVKQATMLAVLDRARGGLTVRDLALELGISRQLALYHAKKLAALGAARGAIMMLEPSEKRGGLQFRLWSESMLARRYGRGAVAA